MKTIYLITFIFMLELSGEIIDVQLSKKDHKYRSFRSKGGFPKTPILHMLIKLGCLIIFSYNIDEFSSKILVNQTKSINDLFSKLKKFRKWSVLDDLHVAGLSKKFNIRKDNYRHDLIAIKYNLKTYNDRLVEVYCTYYRIKFLGDY